VPSAQRATRELRTEMTTSPPVKKKDNSILKALGDLLILCLLLAGAGFGGYFWGTHQQLAPVQKVAPGTSGAISLMPPKSAAASTAASGAESKQNQSETVESDAVETAPSAQASTHHSKNKRKFWITSTGMDYIGYSITVKVNDTPVDNFFGPGKSVDITRLVKHGQNTVECEAKELGEQYNKHTGDANANLTLRVVSGPNITDSFKSNDVLMTYKRTADQTDDATDTLHFLGE
jgi:hypothetical protein